MTLTEMGAVINYPNPFAARTNIQVVLTKPESVSIRITDLLGKEIFHASYGILDAGLHEIGVDAARIGTGTYPYAISTGDSHLN